jgi:hypothetical protein
VTLFDAVTGEWPAASGGLFGDLNAGNYLYAAMPAPVPKDDPYLTGTAWRVTGLSKGSMGCEVLLGYGPVCNLDPYPSSYLGADYFRESVGPVGSYSLSCGAGCWTRDFGVLDSSVMGDRPAPMGGFSDAGTVAPADATIPSTPDAAAIPPDAAAPPPDAAAPPPVDAVGNSCVDLSAVVVAIPVDSTVGNPPPPAGGPLVDGTYVMTSAHAYLSATAAPPTRLSGQFRLTGTTIELAYSGLGIPSFYGRATTTIDGTALDFNYSCSSNGAFSGKISYSAPDGIVDLYTLGAGYTLITRYTKQP